MTLHTLLMQEAEIAKLTKRNKALESGYRSIMKENKKLRAQIAKLTRRENELSGVNI
jgi:septal ring factor EnvC (AmiA/AmiB activator)